MRAFKHASATNSKPSITGSGTEGYCKDGTPGDPTSFTTLPIDWTNDLIDEIKALATGDGEVALDSANPKQIHGRLGGAAAIKSAKDAATGIVSTPHTVFVIGSDLSEADPNTGEFAGLIGCFGSFAHGDGTYLIGSINCELAEDGCIGLGWGATGIVKSGSNQNVKIRLYPATGEIKAARLNSTYGLEVAGATATASYVSPQTWAATCDAAGGTVTVPFSTADADHKVPKASAGVAVVTVTCGALDSGSRLQCTVSFAGGNGFPVFHVIRGTGNFQVLIRNIDPSYDIESDLVIDFEVTNAA